MAADVKPGEGPAAAVGTGGADPATSSSQQRRRVARTFMADTQPKRRKKACCRQCREPFEEGEMRLTLRQKASSGGGWFLHSQCILDGLQATDTIIGTEVISEADRQQLQGLNVKIPTPDTSLDIDPPSALPLDVDDTAYDVAKAVEEQRVQAAEENIMNKGEANVLQNMEWWSSADILKMLKIPVRTMEAPPRDLEAATEEAKLAVARHVVMHGTDEAGWKLLIMMDRFLFAIPPMTEDRSESNTMQARRLVTDRLRHFWNGEWQELAEDANIYCEAAVASREKAEDTPEGKKKLAARIEEMVMAGEVPRALKTATTTAALCAEKKFIPEVRALFPKEKIGKVEINREPAQDSDLWERLEKQMLRDLRSLPRKAGPAMDGSRFEHWMGDSKELRALVAKIGVAWARGQAPDVAYDACRLARLLTPAKPKGGVRPLAITAALRRVVLKSLARVLAPVLKPVLCPWQHAIGVAGGTEKLYHAITTLLEAKEDHVIVALDLKNAFGTMSRKVMRDAMRELVPELDPLVTRLYSGSTPLVWECSGQDPITFEAETGIDAGCPFSCVLFCLGLHKVLQHAREAVPEQAQKAFMDDAYSVCHKNRAKQIIDAFAAAAKRVGMELHMGKIQIYGVDQTALPEALRPWWVDSLTILGNQAERTDMHPPRLESNHTERSTAFADLIVKVEKQVDRIIDLTQYGLSLQTAQALARLIAATKPQYIMRSTLIPMSQRQAFDEVTVKIWTQKVFRGTPAASDPLVKEQLQLPIALGGFSAGGIALKAPAAFISGTVAALPEIHQAAGTTGVDGLRRVHPKLVAEMERATAELKEGTGYRSVEGWMVDRPMALKGKQREWSLKMTEKRKAKLMAMAPRRQKIAIHSGEGVAGVFLSPPEQEVHKIADDHFRIAALRRCGQHCHDSGRQCRNIRQKGERCTAQLDEHGHHGATCECGGAMVRRHNCVRDLLLKRLAEHLGAATHMEQRVDSMAGAGRREARLDVAVTVPGAATHFLDVAIVEAYSSNAGIELQRMERPAAAEVMEGKKRNKYGPSERMIPFIVEAHGRLGPAAMRWIRKVYKGQPDLRRALLQELAATIQSHTAAMVVTSAV